MALTYVRSLRQSLRQSLRAFADRRPFLIRLRAWEYWPMHLVYVPVYLHYLWLALKARSLFFFAAANPGIETGGLFGDSKTAILRRVPEAFKPRGLLLGRERNHHEVMIRLRTAGLHFPLVAKPDVGERGFWVEKIEDEAQLRAYLRAQPQAAVVLQEFVDHPEEVSVLYHRFPGEREGHISSLTLKRFLGVTGDGRSTLRQLIEAYPRARLQLDALEVRLGAAMEEVLPAGEYLELMPIGNHSRGTTFLDGGHLIDEALHRTFDALSHQIEGIYFGRFDIKCQSLDHLKRGEAFKILEINGVKSEPTHIYQPGFSLWAAYGVLFQQWRVIYRLSMANKARGATFMSTGEGLRKFWAWRSYKHHGKALPDSVSVPA